jgi:hypothetical protein
MAARERQMPVKVFISETWRLFSLQVELTLLTDLSWRLPCLS